MPVHGLNLVLADLQVKEIIISQYKFKTMTISYSTDWLALIYFICGASLSLWKEIVPA